MTKVGEGAHPEPLESQTQKELRDALVRFEIALEEVLNAKNKKNIEHFHLVMDREMELIFMSTEQNVRLGLHKQGKIVKSDYVNYRKNPTPESLTRLQQDLSTLHEFSRLPGKL